jgi:hypothetical protein
MTTRRPLYLAVAGVSLLLAACQVPPGGAQSAAGTNDLRGTVTSTNGPEAGVWVIAETRGLDGRIDDPGAGWKGRALWSTYATRAPFHIEGGKGTKSKVLKFQLRPDPLAN